MKLSLRAARVNAGFSQDELAKEIGVSKSTISRWEIGKLKIPDAKLVKFCTLCKLNPHDINL